MQTHQWQVQHVNWVLIGLYFLFCLAQLIFSNWGSMDAAGRGMAGGFLMVYFIFVAVVAGLNLIPLQWVRIIVLILCSIPIVLIIMRTLGRSY